MYDYILLVALFTVMSVIMGRILFWIDGKKFINNFSRKLMDFIPWDYEEIKSSVIGAAYYITPLIFIVILCIVFDYNLLTFFMIDLQYLPYIAVTIFAELSVITMLSGCLTLFSSTANWTNEIGNISWITSIKKRNKLVAPLVPILGALFEETFFRGMVFMMLYTKYPEYGIVPPMVLSAVLFSVEQMLFTNNGKQGLSMFLGSMGISVVACISSAYTGSILPCVLAHQCFLVFYFGRFKFA